MVKPLLPVIAALMLGGCATMAQLNDWENPPALGMSASEVTRMAGTPDRIEHETNDIQAWVYDYDVVRLGPGLIKGKSRTVLFKEGRVVGHRVSKGVTTSYTTTTSTPTT